MAADDSQGEPVERRQLGDTGRGGQGGLVQGALRGHAGGLQDRRLRLEGQPQVLQGREQQQLVEQAKAEEPHRAAEEAAEMGEEVPPHL